MIGGLSKGVNRTEGIKIIKSQINELILFGNESNTLAKELNYYEESNIKFFPKLKEALIYNIKKAK